MEPAAASEAAAAVVPERPPKVDGVLEWQCLVSHRDDSQRSELNDKVLFKK